MDLEQALARFDMVEANLLRLERVWTEAQKLAPDGVAYGMNGSDEGRRYQDLCRGYAALLGGLPPIGGYQITAEPWDLDAIASARFDAMEVGEIEARSAVENAIYEPSREIDEYRFHLAQARQKLVRDRLAQLITEVEGLLANMIASVPRDREPVDDERWGHLRDSIGESERLVGSQFPRVGRWSELRRHLAWAQGQDLHDIADFDWPSVRADIEAGMYSDMEPLPVSVEDLSVLVAERPAGPVTLKLNWEVLSAEEFERLLFNLVAEAEDYANPQWLMRTNAADRGRDISAEWVSPNSLSITQNKRVIIQAKHWQGRSVNIDELTGLLAQLKLWEPPVVHLLVIATSGRFTVDAVQWIERHNLEGARPEIHMWPDSQLELLLARRPHLAAEFRLR